MSKLIGSDFVSEIMTHYAKCSECGRKLHTGDKALVSRRFGKVQKRVCSENCRLNFDNNYWQAIAYRNQGPEDFREA